MNFVFRKKIYEFFPLRKIVIVTHEEQQAEIADLKQQLIQKDKELLEAVKKTEDTKRDSELWKERYFKAVAVKNSIRTNNFVSRTLTEVDNIGIGSR